MLYYLGNNKKKTVCVINTVLSIFNPLCRNPSMWKPRTHGLTAYKRKTQNPTPPIKFSINGTTLFTSHTDIYVLYFINSKRF